MVFVNNKKFACESCIKGHRSSSCHHTERPLFEVKKKGRPVSQCETCRELRQSRRVHSKCSCSSKEAEIRRVPLQSTSQPDKKPKRFIPIVPSLPNGIRDALQPSSSCMPSHSRQRVDSLLNPCRCKDVRRCSCGAIASGSCDTQSEGRGQTNLATLAQAAAMCCGRDLASTTRSSGNKIPNIVRRVSHGNSARQQQRNRCSGLAKNHSHTSFSPPVSSFDLPPIVQSMPITVPEFAMIPPLSTIRSIAGSGCTCGLHCGCPGCAEHRGVENASKERDACPDRCGTCIDYSAGIELPGQGSGGSMIDAFFARAASLPLPPTNRKMGVTIDPMNVMVYPSELFIGDAEERGAAYGLVKLPKLECCGGRCGCPRDGCGCGKTCGGRCAEHRKEAGRPLPGQVAA